jgi:undecaprenyl-diphosphatase
VIPKGDEADERVRRMSPAVHSLGVLEAAAAGLLQGVAEIFPISGLGHAVLVGALGNGAGDNLAPQNSGYLYSCLRIAVGLALLIHLWRDWLWVGRGLAGALVRPSAHATERRWTGLVLLATVPSAVAVGVLARRARTLATHPVLAAVCLAAGGVLLLAIWFWFRRSPRSGGLSGTHRARLTRGEDAETFVAELSTLRPYRVALIGWLPVAELVPGISGIGLAICAGLLWGLTQEQAARAALLVITPLLLTWGLVEFPDLGAAQYDNVRTAVFVASGVAFVAAYLVISLVLRYFRTASLRPFGYYSVLAGGAALFWLSR